MDNEPTPLLLTNTFVPLRPLLPFSWGSPSSKAGLSPFRFFVCFKCREPKMCFAMRFRLGAEMCLMSMTKPVTRVQNGFTSVITPRLRQYRLTVAGHSRRQIKHNVSSRQFFMGLSKLRKKQKKIKLSSQLLPSTLSTHVVAATWPCFHTKADPFETKKKLQLRLGGGASGLGAVLLQQLKRHNLHRLLVGALQHHQGRLPSPLRLQPSRGAQTPAFSLECRIAPGGSGHASKRGR